MATTTVRKLFNKFDIFDIKQVKWGASFDEHNQGVYVISSSNNPDKHLGISAKPKFDDNKINFWINSLSNFSVGGSKATLLNVKEHLSEFWLPDESILYIGKAPKRGNGDGISNRVKEYYSTTIGKSGPHSGGQWIKILENLNSFTVYYGECNNPSDIEFKMLEYFMSNVSQSSLSEIYDKKLPVPFANIKYKGNKNHKLKNQRL